MSFFHRCRSCLQTFPAFSSDVTICALCGSPDIEEAAEIGMGERLERGAIYRVDLTSGRLAKLGGSFPETA